MAAMSESGAANRRNAWAESCTITGFTPGMLSKANAREDATLCVSSTMTTMRATARYG